MSDRGEPERFKVIRFCIYSIVIISSSVVLGLAANFASLFLPHIERSYSIFSIVVPASTIVAFTMVLIRSVPSFDAMLLFALDVLWLTQAAWTTDIIGFVQCFTLAGKEMPTKNGTISSQQWCDEMKAIEAFSWANFAILTISLLTLIVLVSQATAMGRYEAWNESMSELPWFGEMRSPYGYGGGGGFYGGGMPMYGGGGQPFVVQQAPGHSVVIQPNPGGPPTVHQVPGMVQSPM